MYILKYFVEKGYHVTKEFHSRNLSFPKKKSAPPPMQAEKNPP